MRHSLHDDEGKLSTPLTSYILRLLKPSTRSEVHQPNLHLVSINLMILKCYK